MNIKSIKNLWIASLLLLTQNIDIYAQKDEKAKEILQSVTAAYEKLGGVDIKFGGSVNGTISLKNNMFMVDCDGVKTWFDGVTQWSYIEANNEVNISTPTIEEQNLINPYSILRMYEEGFNYKYAGKKKFGGETCDEIILTPEIQQYYECMKVLINPKMEPINIEFIYSEAEKEIITVKKYQKNDKLSEDNFRFDMDAHSDAEIIDLR